MEVEKLKLILILVTLEKKNGYCFSVPKGDRIEPRAVIETPERSFFKSSGFLECEFNLNRFFGFKI